MLRYWGYALKMIDKIFVIFILGGWSKCWIKIFNIALDGIRKENYIWEKYRELLEIGLFFWILMLFE